MSSKETTKDFGYLDDLNDEELALLLHDNRRQVKDLEEEVKAAQSRLVLRMQNSEKDEFEFGTPEVSYTATKYENMVFGLDEVAFKELAGAVLFNKLAPRKIDKSLVEAALPGNKKLQVIVDKTKIETPVSPFVKVARREIKQKVVRKKK